MNTIDTPRGRAALIVANCAGMVGLIALPIWVGALVVRYGFDPQQAGGLATLFLAGMVVASVWLAPRFHRVDKRKVATFGFGVSAAGCALAATSSDFGTLAVLHALCGLASGAALSATHGTIACSAQPQRLFAFAGMGMGVFAVLFIGVTPLAISAAGGPALFLAFALVMAVATAGCALGFPRLPRAAGPAGPAAAPPPLVPAVWFGSAGIALMAVVQAMTLSFLERMGRDKGFTEEAVAGVLVALSVAALFPAPLAALLEKRLPPKRVLLVGSVLHALMTVTVVATAGFVPFAIAACLFPGLLMFSHMFAFGLLARLDPSGRALAATPAMLMIGSAVGPVLGGTLAKFSGYGSLGIAAAALGILTLVSFSRLPSAASPAAASPHPDKPLPVES